MLLCEYNVPLIRATWFIKLSSAYTVAVSEAKIKSKRQLPDPTLGMLYRIYYTNKIIEAFKTFYYNKNDLQLLYSYFYRNQCFIFVSESVFLNVNKL